MYSVFVFKSRMYSFCSFSDSCEKCCFSHLCIVRLILRSRCAIQRLNKIQWCLHPPNLTNTKNYEIKIMKISQLQILINFVNECCEHTLQTAV
jgi:hypothetical protein